MDIDDCNEYRLYSVLVHNGDIYYGHYYSFQRPKKTSDWYKFDDELVTRATSEQAIDENFGETYNTNGNATKQNQHANACKFLFTF